MALVLNIDRLKVVKIAIGVVGIGPQSIYYRKVSSSDAAIGIFQYSLTNVVGNFSALQINTEYSADGLTNWEVVSTWDTMGADSIGFANCAEAGFFRLNVTTFTGGTSFDVYAQISPVGESISGGGSSGLVTQGTIPWTTRDASDGMSGNPAPGYTNQIGGVDSSGDLTTLKTLSDGTLVVTNSGAAESVAAYSVNTGLVLKSVTSLTALLSIKPQSASLRTFSVQGIDLGGDGSIAHFRLIRNASLTGASFVNVGGTSQMRFDTSASAFLGGDIVDSGYYAIGSHTKIFMNLQFNSVSDIFTLVFAGVNSRPANVGASFRWSEQ